MGLSLLSVIYGLFRKSSLVRTLLSALLVGGTILSIHVSILQHSAVAELIGQSSEVRIRVTVTSEAKRTSTQVRGSRVAKSKQSFLGRTSEIIVEGSETKVRVPIRILTDDKSLRTLGEEIEISGFLIKTPEKRVAATIIGSGQIVRISDASLLMNFLSDVRAKFRDRLSRYGDDGGSLIPGMIIGDTSLQTSEFSEQMRRAGLSHLTAVSGANFAIVSSMVFLLSRRIVSKIVARLILSSSFMVLFLLLVRPSPSVLRAGVMAAVVLVARASGNSRNAVSALATAISVLILIDPFQGLDPGFILSVLATGGLIFIAPKLSERLQRYLPESAAEMIAVPCAATLTCTPYLIILVGEVSALSIVFNVLVAPTVAPITILGFLSLITMPVGILSSALIWPAHVLAMWITTVARWSDSSPSLEINFWLLLSILVFLFWLHAVGARKLSIGFLVIILAGTFLSSFLFPGRDWRIVQCDVGQGDALIVNIGDGDGILFDAGPEPRALIRCLHLARIKRLSLVIVSHGHADHYFGADGLLQKIPIGEIWSNGNTDISDLIGSEVKRVRQGTSARIGDTYVEILWPNDSPQSFTSLRGDGSQENNQSVVVLLRQAGVQVLITGDIEPEVQAILARNLDLADVDILKVPHHGSRFQDTKFIHEVSPVIALVSVGAGNSYGHPNAGLLKTFAAQGIRVFRTDKDGPISVAWRFDDGGGRYIFTTRTMRRQWWRIQWR